MLPKKEKKRFHTLRDLSRAWNGVEGLRSQSRGGFVFDATGVNLNRSSSATFEARLYGGKATRARVGASGLPSAG